MQTTKNYQKYTSKNPLKKLLINNFLDRVEAVVIPLKPKSILDAGCGEGFALERLKEKKIGKTLLGIDSSNRALKTGRLIHPDIFFKKGDIYQLDFADNNFDLVICLEVLEHLPYPKKALDEILRVSKRYCLISVPHEPFFGIVSSSGRSEHLNHWSVKSITSFLGEKMKILNILKPFPWLLILGEKPIR